jgi:hypothetical protein
MDMNLNMIVVKMNLLRGQRSRLMSGRREKHEVEKARHKNNNEEKNAVQEKGLYLETCARRPWVQT